MQAEAGVAVAMMRMLEDLPAAVRHARTAVKLAEANGLPQLLPDFLARQALIEGLLGRPRQSPLRVALPRSTKASPRSVPPATGLLAGAQRRPLHARGDPPLGGRPRRCTGPDRRGTGDLRRDRRRGLGSPPPAVSRNHRLAHRRLEAGVVGRGRGVRGRAPDRTAVQQAVLAGTRSLLLAISDTSTKHETAAEHALDMSTRTGAMFGTMLDDRRARLPRALAREPLGRRSPSRTARRAHGERWDPGAGCGALRARRDRGPRRARSCRRSRGAALQTRGASAPARPPSALAPPVGPEGCWKRLAADTRKDSPHWSQR